MARMHARRKGKAGSTRPLRSKHPEWSALKPREIEGQIIELAKNEKSSSEIGMILRDQFAVPDVKLATGKKVTTVMRANGFKSDIPEDMTNLIRTALKIRKHLETNHKDIKNRRNLQLTESKIRRLMKYYHRQNKLPTGWKYSPAQAKLMFE